jgi:insecticidal toxin complex protein TccC
MVNVCALHTHTPTLSVNDPRGLPVRSVSFHRTRADESVTERVDRSGYDSAGRLTRRWDPRLWDRVGQDFGTPSNLSFILSLTAQPLLSERVDAGWDVEFCGSAGERRCRWDAKANVQRFEYDSMLRTEAVFESDGLDERCTERLTYGGANDAFANQCGQLIRHDDPAGSVANRVFSLTGEVIEQTRRFVKDLSVSDWPLLVSDRDAVLEPGEGARSAWRFGPLGDALEQTDAMGNVQAFARTVAGQLKSTGLQLRGQSPQTLVSDIAYDAQGCITSENAGNGVNTAVDYDPVDGRLIRLRTDNGHLQDLNYAYDAVGNVLQIEDLAQPTRHFANQQVEPLRTFAYDTLYQLIEATGYEAKTMNRGPANDAFRRFVQADELAGYTQRYEYDAAGNLQTLTHTGAQHSTRRFATASTSNRSVLQTADQPPSEEQIAEAFDANGNLRALQAGQDLAWNSRNQLSEVTPVVRESGINDSEVYRYDAAGLRVRKVRTTQAKIVTHLNEVRYLPCLEIRTNTATGEVLHVITATAGRSDVRVLHWQAEKPETLENEQVRYSLCDHLGSSTLELSADAQLISQEIYYPYGETAWFAGRGDVEVSYKTLRYSGKERDATGLYYYGLRYYAPWLLRWINPDPAGESGGINLYCFCLNSPIRYHDNEGAAPTDVPITITVAKGMGDYNAVQLSKMRKVIKLSRNMVKGTRRQLLKKGESSDGVNEAFDATFGNLPSEVRAETVTAVAEAFKDQERILKSFGKPEGLEIELFDGPLARLGATSFSGEFEDEVEKIRISKHHLENDHALNVAATLIHETSHAASFTVDTHYYQIPLLANEATAEHVGQWSAHLRQQLKKVSRRGPREAPDDAGDYATAMEGLGPGLADSDLRKEAFKNDPRIRASLLQMNADTFATLVMATKLPKKWMSSRARRSGQSGAT